MTIRNRQSPPQIPNCFFVDIIISTCPPYPLLLCVCVCVWEGGGGGGGGGWGKGGGGMTRNDIDKATGNRLFKDATW